MPTVLAKVANHQRVLPQRLGRLLAAHVEVHMELLDCAQLSASP